ncbi:hypothetical protein [Streptococcus merionis]|uniref:hypothetical protein n=1 Tax=Streptococcus merionis TaxID=400065 RepID=UPI00039AB477|nr:hypothetical protein [Streptococcus merionis]
MRENLIVLLKNYEIVLKIALMKNWISAIFYAPVLTVSSKASVKEAPVDDFCPIL